MQLLIASGLLVALGAYLLHEFWTRTLAADDNGASKTSSEVSGTETEAQERLKAA